MRVTLRVLAALVAAPATLAAQGGVQAGVEGALNFSRLTGSDADGLDSRTGFAAGGFLRLPVSSSFAIEPAFYYSMQGAKGDLGGGSSITFKIDYFQLPIRLRYSPVLGSNPALRPYFYVAPAIGIRDSCKLLAKAQGQSLEVDCDDEDALGGFSFDTKAIETGFHLGAGAEYQRVSLGVRYQVGLNSVDDSDLGADIKHRFFAIVAGYRFGGPR